MPDDGPLVVSGDLVIPAAELRWRFDPSAGPGGQHTNKAATRAELSWDAGRSEALSVSLRTRLIARLGGRAPGGVITVSVDETRSQWRNRVIARRRLAGLLHEALRPERIRLATRVPPGSRRRRLEAKRRRSEAKRLRRPPGDDAA